MTKDLAPVVVDTMPGNGLSAQDVASFGAILAGQGFTALKVQGITARIQKLATQVTLQALSEIMEDLRQIQEARFTEIINQVATAPGLVPGMISRNQVVQIITNVAAKTPRQ